MSKTMFEFEQWPLDLLVDYALKIHHRRIHEEGPRTLERLEKVAENAEDDRLATVENLFRASLDDLENHLAKEEQVLFPHLYNMTEAVRSGEQVPLFHCGSVRFPIEMMMSEHASELIRWEDIRILTDDFTVTEGAGKEHAEVVGELKEFLDALKEHIHIENDIIFPGYLDIEDGRKA